MKELKELNCGKWIPEYVMVRTENGWVLPNELTKKEKLLIYDNEEVIGKCPKAYYKVFFEGYLVGNDKIRFKPSKLDDEWFETKTILGKHFYESDRKYYKGYLYSFNFNPIVSYNYKISKVNNNNLLKVEYVI